MPIDCRKSPYFCTKRVIKHMSCKCCRKQNPFQGLRVGSCLTLRNELPDETHELIKQETSLGRCPGGAQ